MAVTGASAGKTRRFLLMGLAGMLFLTSAVNVFLQNETYRDEVTFWSDNVRKAPGLHRPHHNLARALTQESRYDEALEEMNRALGARGASFVFQKAATYSDRGELLAYRGELEAAKSDFIKAVEMAPFFPKPYIGLTKVMMRQAKLDEALKYSRKSVELEPGSAEYRVFHSMVLLRGGHLDEAGKSAAAALVLRGEYLPAWLVLTELERKRGHRERALSLFEAVMAQAPSESAACDLMKTIYRYLYGQEDNISCEDGRDRLLAYYGGKSSSP
jgi:tetratricopeptide (TPR) repeat protein